MAGEKGFSISYVICGTKQNRRFTILCNQTIKVNYSILFTLVYEGFKLYVTFSKENDAEKNFQSRVWCW